MHTHPIELYDVKRISQAAAIVACYPAYQMRRPTIVPFMIELPAEMLELLMSRRHSERNRQNIRHRPFVRHEFARILYS